ANPCERGLELVPRLAQFAFGPPPPYELTDLAADRGERAQHVLVTSADLGGQEFHHAERLASEDDRRGKGRVEAGPLCARRPGEVRVGVDVLDPRRVVALPDATRQPHAPREPLLPAIGGELQERRRGLVPGIDERELIPLE